MTITKISYRSAQTPVRDQGPRPTCAVFAVTGAHEWMRSEPTDLSEEHCLWAAKRVDGDKTQSTSIPSALVGIAADGQATEADWPYGHPLFDAGPPATVTAATCFKPGASRPLEHATLADMALVLDSGAAVVLRVAVVFPAWAAAASGGVVDAPPGQIASDLHAVLAVGVQTLNGDDVIEFKNSWGETWGEGGFGYLTSAYWTRYGRAAWALEH
jgi:hypothetical protein